MSKESEKLVAALDRYLAVRAAASSGLWLTVADDVAIARQALADELDQFHSYCPILELPEEP